MKIVFMGTPEFAVQSLLKLAESKHDLVGVVTVPDKPQGRGQKMGVSAVKVESEKMGLPLLQPESLKDPAFLDDLEKWKADCFAVVAFRILPVAVFEMPPLGTVNLHASLLPKYRGAAPIQWSLMNGDTETGVSTFYIQKKVDTGDILLQEKVQITDDMNVGHLHDALSIAGAELLVETMDGIAERTLLPRQQEGNVTLAPKILQSHCEIDWARSAFEIRNQIRALSPRPGAYSQLHGKRIKIFEASIKNDRVDFGKSGDVVDVQNSLIVKTGDGFLGLEVVQQQGKRKMNVGDFLRGYEVHAGDCLGDIKK